MMARRFGPNCVDSEETIRKYSYGRKMSLRIQAVLDDVEVDA